MKRIIIFVIGLMLMTALFVYVDTANGIIKPTLVNEVHSDKLQEAIDFLAKYPKHQKYVEDRLTLIRTGSLSKVIITEDDAIFEITDKFINYHYHSVKYLASVLVHEAKHVDQRRPFLVFSDQMAELDANNFQAMALLDFDGDRYQIDGLMSSDGLHFDTNGNGILDAEDNWGW